MKAGLTELNLRLLATLVFVGFVTATFASGRAAQDGKLKDAQSVAEGAKLFAPNCSSGYCHGVNGSGGGGPRLRGKNLEADYLFKTISNGITGTTMPSFKSVLSEEQIWKVVAFIMSDVKEGAEMKAEPSPATSSTSAPATKSPDSEGAASIVGNAQAGKALFFDSARQKSCRACHSFAGEGATVGPDLSKVGNRPAREIFLSIILPREAKDSRYRRTTLTLKNGEKVTGVKSEEDGDSIRIYDVAELPAVLRTVPKSDVAKSETVAESPMPRDYATVYTLKQILDIVTFLKSSDSQPKPVTLSDIF